MITNAGVGKTHYVKKRLQLEFSPSNRIIIVMNETFSIASLIKELHKLPHKEPCAIFLNFTIHDPGVSLHALTYTQDK